MINKLTKVASLLLILSSVLIYSNNIITCCAEGFDVERAFLTVYGDGVVHVNIKLRVNEDEPAITLPLLGPLERVSNVLAVDEDGSVLYHEVNEDGTITIYTLGSTRVTLTYDTDGLTAKVFGLWMINFTSPFPLTLILPEDATILYLNDIPQAIRSRDGRVELDLGPGSWEISYELPIRPPTPTLTPLRLEYVIIIGVVITILTVTMLTIRFKLSKRRAMILRNEEAEIIRYIKERGGRALEAELREKFPHIPKTTMWRMIRRLERNGLVRVRKVGLQNLVELT